MLRYLTRRVRKCQKKIWTVWRPIKILMESKVSMRTLKSSGTMNNSKKQILRINNLETINKTTWKVNNSRTLMMKWANKIKKINQTWEKVIRNSKMCSMILAIRLSIQRKRKKPFTNPTNNISRRPNPISRDSHTKIRKNSSNQQAKRTSRITTKGDDPTNPHSSI